MHIVFVCMNHLHFQVIFVFVYTAVCNSQTVQHLCTAATIERSSLIYSSVRGEQCDGSALHLSHVGVHLQMLCSQCSQS